MQVKEQIVPVDVQLTLATFEPIILVHDEQDVFPVPELYSPLAQVVHDAFPVPTEYVPAAQGVQAEAPAVEKLPAGQVEQDVLLPELALYVPAVHFTQLQSLLSR